jgi:hypothetical protein
MPTQSGLGPRPTEAPGGEVRSFVVGERIVAEAIGGGGGVAAWKALVRPRCVPRLLPRAQGAVEPVCAPPVPPQVRAPNET